MFLHTIQIRKNRSLDAKKKGFQKVETERKKLKKGGGELLGEKAAKILERRPWKQGKILAIIS